ncbi:MAG: hypothetical protein GYA23_10615 [Methanomicrobiales archaeon]|nr:hypothetical protein [Methanomicrobiales archaeon]
MNFGSIANIGGAAASYLQTPEGQDAVKKFLASPQGIQLLSGFVGTPEGKTTMAGVMPQFLSGLNLPAGTTETVLGALLKK